jgi:small-conductance mechanosensitive channel
MPEFLRHIPADIVLAATIFVAALALLIFIKAFVGRQLKRLSARGNLGFLSYPEKLLEATRFPFIFAVAALAALNQLELTARQEKYVAYAWIVILVLQVALWINRLADLAFDRTLNRYRSENPAGATHIMVMGLICRIALWTIALLVMLDNLGFNVTTLMASLGIGGIAVALAVQNILGDVFSSISIALDKPFVIGDFIIVESYMGTVEYVGLKTTRLRSLDGEQIIFSNSELLKNRIRNYKRMQERRVQFSFNLDYETPHELVRQAPALIRAIVEAQAHGQGQGIRFDRAHFKGYGDNALQFEVVYFLPTPDFNLYMDVQQSINLAMLEQFRAAGINFAYVTRTQYLDHENGPPPIRPQPQTEPQAQPRPA